jgi:hypothetical protein
VRAAVNRGLLLKVSVEMQPTLHDGKPGIFLKSDGLENLVQSCGTA